MQILNVLAKADVDAIRHETFEGNDHLVIPIIALVEGVIQSSNATNPELALASEFAAHVRGWNGRPVVMKHPDKDENQDSANDPEVLETE